MLAQAYSDGLLRLFDNKGNVLCDIDCVPALKQVKHWDWGNDGENEPQPPEPYNPNQLILFSFDETIDKLIQEPQKVEA